MAVRRLRAMSYEWEAAVPPLPALPLSPAEEAFLRALGPPTPATPPARPAIVPEPTPAPTPSALPTGVIRRRRSDPGAPRGR